jgi:DNA-binding CsgD family transcriptional regulator
MSDLSSQDLPLIEYLMGANINQDGWQSLLAKFLEHFNLRHINLYMLDSKFNLLFQEWSGVQPTVKALKAYMDDIFPTDKVHQTMLMSPECKWVTGNFEPYQSMLNATPYFHEWTKQHNFPYTTGCVLYRGQQGQVMVTFQRGEEHGPFTVEEEGRFTQVSKYLSKAVELRVKISGQDKNDLRLKSVLNKLRLPVTAVNEFGDIVAHNDAMLGFLQSQDALIIEGSHLALFNDGDNKKLKHAIVKSVAQSKDFESSVDSDSSIITVNKGGNSFVIGTCELSDKTAGTDQFSGALLYVVSPDLLKPTSAEQLQRIFLFTNAESVVCSLFAQNMSLKEIAAQENKSVNTVREQLQNCYVKTHTKNQLELVNLLSGLPSEG